MVTMGPQRDTVQAATGRDHERRNGRNWSETDTGGTSGMGTSRTNGDRDPTGASEATGRAAGAARARRASGADRAAWQDLREEVREGWKHARSE